MRSASLVPVSFLVASLVLTGCGKTVSETMIENAMEQNTDQDVDIDYSNESMTIETDEGTATIGKDEVPEDWPSDVPVYPNTAVNMASSGKEPDGSLIFALYLTSKDSVADIIAYYKRELAAKGWSLDTDMSIQSEEMMLMGATKDSRTVSIMVNETGEEATITIGVGEDRM